RESPPTIIECFCEVVIPSSGNESAWILQKFPETYSNDEILKSVPEFAYPCEFSSTAVQHFSFVLTSIDSKWTFGYCRHAPNSQTCFVLLSYLPWHETFYKVLNQIAELANKKDSSLLGQFLGSLYNCQVPEPGFQLRVAFGSEQIPFQCACSDHTKLPSIPENRNLTEYFNAVDATNMITIFARQRRILITSKRLSRLSACVQAANALIYPMEWQHIFIPVLPNHLLDYLSAPMPFLIGVPTTTLARVSGSELGEVVVLDADNNKIESPFRDLESIPSEIVTPLKRSLRNPSLMLGDGVSQAFLRALVRLIGGYREALCLQLGERITFDPERFLQSRPPNLRTCLEKMLQLQIFHQAGCFLIFFYLPTGLLRSFIEGRLQILNAGKVNNDIFELEVNMFDDSSNKQFKQHYKYWLANMKKEGGALLKTMKSKANPAVRNAYKNVKDKGKKAYSNIQGKFTGMQKGTQDDMALSRRDMSQPRSAPASPTMDRKRPVTFQPLPRVRELSIFFIACCDTGFHFSSLKSPSRSTTEIGLDVVSEMTEDTVSTCSFQPIDMDLMGDLQEIFSRVSTTDTQGQSNHATGSPAPAERQNTLISMQAFSDPSLHKVPLAPPPRSSRRTAARSPSSEAPLIRLDSQEGETKQEPVQQQRSSDHRTRTVQQLAQQFSQVPTQFPRHPPPQLPQHPPPQLPQHPLPQLPQQLAQPLNRLPPSPNPFVRPYGGAMPYSGLQQRFQAVPYMGSPSPGLSTNPFVRQPWTPPMAPPPRQHAPPPAVPRQQDPFADLIDL
ncbi:unnamed protein product, partial [Ixodes hexagonus]